MAEEKKKNPLQKIKESIDDKEEQLAIISLFVRLGVVIWSGFRNKNDEISNLPNFPIYYGSVNGIMKKYNFDITCK